MTDRERRLAENEVLYREVNEQVRALHDRLGSDDGFVEFICECAQLACQERIELTLDEYESLRADGARFALKHGHEVPDVETVVERNERYEVVEKHPGGASLLAETEDPRG